MFLPRSSILSWRSKECVFSIDDSYIREMEEQCNDTKEQLAVSSENLSDSSSVQDLTSLFSKLSLHESLGKVAVETPDETSSVNIGFNDEHSSQAYLRKAWCFSDINEPIIQCFKEFQLANYQDHSNNFALAFESLFSSNSQGCHGDVILYKSSNIGTDCVETIWEERNDFRREDDSCWMPMSEVVRSRHHLFIDFFSSFYRYRSPFSSFLTTLLARAGRLKDNSHHFVKEHICILKESLNKKGSAPEVRQEDSEYRYSLRRVPSQKQETHPDEQHTWEDNSQRTVEGDFEVDVKDVTSIEELETDPTVQQYIEEHETLNGAEKTLFQEWKYLELSVATPEKGFYPDEDKTAEQDMYPGEELTFSTLEQELTMVAEQARLTPKNEICAREKVIFAENPGQDTFVAEKDIHMEERTLVEQQDVSIEKLHASIKDRSENPVLACMKEFDNLLPEMEAHYGIVHNSRENTCVDKQENSHEGQDIYLEGQGTYLKRQENYFEIQETCFEGQMTYLDGQETDIEEQETHVENKETNLEGQATYFDWRETYLEGKETFLDEQETYLEGQETFLEGHETCSDEQRANFKQEGDYPNRMVTYFEGLGEETYQTVRNVSPRARDLFRRARNFSRC